MNSIKRLEYFKGSVRFVGQGFINAKYSLVVNGTIFKVKNSFHIRLIQKQLGKFPESFDIIAPIKAIKILSGEIPKELIFNLPESEYLELSQIYHDL